MYIKSFVNLNVVPYMRPFVKLKRHRLCSQWKLNSSMSDNQLQTYSQIMLCMYMQYLQTCGAHSHSRQSKQTQAVNHLQANSTCIDNKRRSDRHHLLDIVLEKGPSRDSRLSLSPCTPSSEDMEGPAKHPPLCLRLSATIASSSRAVVP